MQNSQIINKCQTMRLTFRSMRWNLLYVVVIISIEKNKIYWIDSSRFHEIFRIEKLTKCNFSFNQTKIKIFHFAIRNDLT